MPDVTYADNYEEITGSPVPVESVAVIETKVVSAPAKAPHKNSTAAEVE